MRDVHVALLRGRSVLLHGNTRDAVLFEGEFRDSILTFLREYFRAVGAD